MTDIVYALALVLLVEGAVYALFPDFMKNMMAEMMRLTPGMLRGFGLAAALFGAVVVWLVRG